MVEVIRSTRRIARRSRERLRPGGTSRGPRNKAYFEPQLDCAAAETISSFSSSVIRPRSRKLPEVLAVLFRPLRWKDLV